MGDDDWLTVMALEELPDGKPLKASLDGLDVLIVRDGERLFAIGNRCPHQGAPLHRGRPTLASSLPTVTCPVHGSVFDLASGAVRRGPATSPVPAYDVRVNGGEIQIREKA